jgi:protein SCO1/2
MRPCLLFVLLLAGCASQKPLPVLGEIPQFQLTSQQGTTFDRSRLDGHVWIADFIYTNCEGPCPRMSSRMRAMQNQLPASVRFVSFTVDPVRDKPAELAAYGQKFGADTSRWTFLTGDRNTLNTLDRDAFKLGTIGVDMDHSTRFVLVDKKGRVRGYYGLTDDGLLGHIARDAERLEREQA